MFCLSLFVFAAFSAAPSPADDINEEAAKWLARVFSEWNPTMPVTPLQWRPAPEDGILGEIIEFHRRTELGAAAIANHVTQLLTAGKLDESQQKKAALLCLKLGGVSHTHNNAVYALRLFLTRSKYPDVRRIAAQAPSFYVEFYGASDQGFSLAASTNLLTQAYFAETDDSVRAALADCLRTTYHVPAESLEARSPQTRRFPRLNNFVAFARRTCAALAGGGPEVHSFVKDL
jgi:hypothetical protein